MPGLPCFSVGGCVSASSVFECVSLFLLSICLSLPASNPELLRFPPPATSRHFLCSCPPPRPSPPEGDAVACLSGNWFSGFSSGSSREAGTPQEVMPSPLPRRFWPLRMAGAQGAPYLGWGHVESPPTHGYRTQCLVLSVTSGVWPALSTGTWSSEPAAGREGEAGPRPGRGLLAITPHCPQ